MNITIVGNGRVASHLASALKSGGHTILQIIGRTKERANTLSKKVGAQAIDHLQDLNINTEILILAVPDDVLGKQFTAAIHPELIVVHTSGSVPMEVLKNHSKHGIFYPLQTFSIDHEADFSTIPICIEANNTACQQKLIKLAKDISNTVVELDSEKRKQLHLAAVFACNFTNHLFSISKELLDSKQLPYDLLKPLILETARKGVENNPDKVQTGPAVRNDKGIIHKHLGMISDKPQLEQLYQLLTQMIYEKQSPHEEL